MKSYDKQFIGGEWRTGTGSAVMDNCNPFSGEVLYTYRSAGPDDIDAAYKAAAAAQRITDADAGDDEGDDHEAQDSKRHPG